MMSGEELGVRVTEACKQPGRALNVREEEGQCCAQSVALGHVLPQETTSTAVALSHDRSCCALDAPRRARLARSGESQREG